MLPPLPTLPPLAPPYFVRDAVTKRRERPAKLLGAFQWDSGAGRFQMHLTQVHGDDTQSVTHARSGSKVVTLIHGESAAEGLVRIVKSHGLTRVASTLRMDEMEHGNA